VSLAGRRRALVWFRRDLRADDHAALARATHDADEVFCAFVFDRPILDELPGPADRRVDFIHRSVRELDATLRGHGGALAVMHDDARVAIPRLARRLGVDAVYANRDYEPYARSRDDAVAAALARAGIAFESPRDQVIFERGEIVTREGRPYSVFTPYKRAWLATLTPDRLAPRRVRHAALAGAPDGDLQGIPSLPAMGFRSTDLDGLGVATGASGGAARFAAFRRRIDDYAQARDFPAVEGASRLSVHLRFGTVSIRALARFAHERSLRPRGEGAATWLSELVWRDFYAQILWHHPRVVDQPFRPELADLLFPDDPAHVSAWREGRTGYPIVDAGMRQLNATGYMHNRLRMVTASFLVKDLLVDWKIGERYFADKLIDFDLSSNNGGWQWAASTGCDAQPWFRIFNPLAQSRRFDPQGTFIRRHVPEIAHLDDQAIHAPWSVAAERGTPPPADYPPPIVDHARAREAALALFGRHLRAA
jgi:deoxyribodipyrimidine photo-lyase